MKTVNTSYQDFLNKVIAKGLLPQYTEDASSYFLFAVESGVISWETILSKGSDDAADFEDNHQSSFNKPLEVKAGPGRPIRTASSPQPINTIQHFKGYKLTLAANTTSNYIDISFASLVYIKGGRFYCANIQTDDHVSADLLLASNDMVIVPNIVEDCYLVDNGTIPFESAESMALAPEFKLRITIEGTSSITARTVYIVAEYFL